MHCTKGSRSSRYSIIGAFVGIVGLVLGLAGSATATQPSSGEISFEGTAHLPVFPSPAGDHGHLYGTIDAATFSGVDSTGTAWSVTASSDPLGDNDLYAGFDYQTISDCEVFTAAGSGWIHVGGSGGMALGTYGATPVTNLYVEFDFARIFTVTPPTITLSDVDVWLNADVDVEYSSPKAKGGPHPHVLPAPGPGAGAIQVIGDHSGVGEAVLVPQGLEQLEQTVPRCVEGDPSAINSDFHVDVTGIAEDLL